MGPWDEATEVKEVCEPPLELTVDAMELTRGDEVPEEYACWGCGKGRVGSLSLYNGRWAAWAL